MKIKSKIKDVYFENWKTPLTNMEYLSLESALLTATHTEEETQIPKNLEALEHKLRQRTQESGTEKEISILHTNGQRMDRVYTKPSAEVGGASRYAY